MKNILITGGTVFASKYTAKYFVQKKYNVYVLNRNTKEQVDGVNLIQADRQELGGSLQKYHFDAVLDVTAYSGKDVDSLIDAIGSFDKYILISSSAVYPENAKQPFTELTALGENKIWGQYGIGKIEAEKSLINKFPDGYILRPPYLYGPMNNVYREAFVFDCAINDHKFYLPKDGKMNLQFLYINDLCKMMEKIIENEPVNHIFNVGNSNSISIKKWVEICYKAAGKTPEFVNVYNGPEQRKYFSFYDYDYYLDVNRQKELLAVTEELENGIRESYEWYINNTEKVNRKPYFDYIDNNL